MERALILLCGIALAAVAATPAQAGKRDDTLNLTWIQQIENYDQYFNTVREGIVFAREVWDTLIDRDPKTGAYRPLLAKSFRWVDPTTLEVELRQGITFHDGSAFGPDDVVY